MDIVAIRSYVTSLSSSLCVCMCCKPHVDEEGVTEVVHGGGGGKRSACLRLRSHNEHTRISHGVETPEKAEVCRVSGCQLKLYGESKAQDFVARTMWSIEPS